jgi:type VI secretion system protein ImpA
MDDVRGIEAHITEKVGAANAPDFELLQDELRAISVIYAEHLSRRGVNVAQDGEAVGGNAGVAGQSGEIRSRDDAVRMLDKVSEYFRRNEPSSPVPMLLQRAKGLVAKDFMEILRDLTPEAVKKAELYSRSGADD